MNHEKFKHLVEQLYKTVNELESMFPGRHFTPDGHMVGSIGECLVADAYDLTLENASNKGFDAKTRSGKQVEIKATQSTSVAFRSEAQHAIVIKILPDGSFLEIYNGPGDIIWKQFHGKKLPKNGQYQISVNKLVELNESVDGDSRIPKTFSL
ncbi:MAG: hypothetical protein ACI9O6_002431 [Glaciecola sp.]|jgi:hypothetical protein